MGELSPWHWAIVVLAFVLLFGAAKLPDAARGLGRSVRILKSELRGAADDPPAQPVAAHPAPAPPDPTQADTSQAQSAGGSNAAT